jgi:hypothetical protein
MILGGSISKDAIFKYILSIGYEFEIPLLAKFTYMPNDILVNTDLNIGRIREVEYSELDDEYEINKKIRYGEIKNIESNDWRIIPTILNNNISDDLTDENNLLIQISTDVSTNVKTIKTIFEDYCVMNELSQQELINLDNDYDDTKEKEQDKIKEINKDNLYQFKIFENNEYTKVYKINFAHDSLRACNEFTDVEFIATYYKPKLTENIILDTFVNAISNITAYVDSLQIQKGSFFIKDSLQNNEYIIVEYPTLRNLLIDPNSSVRFINMNVNYKNNDSDIYNLTVTPQMTFSCQIEHLFSIVKELYKNSGQTQNYNEFTNNINNNLQTQLSIIIRIENIVNELFRNYNNLYTPKFTDEQINILKNYVGLILYKLYKYYNSYLPEINIRKTYLKDKLSINSRHLNIQLYDKLKENIANMINDNDMNKTIDIIHNLILQPNILSNIQTGLINKTDNVRKNAFKKSNILDISNYNYGNPYYSLRSYFDHFENPIKNLEGGGKIKPKDLILDSSADNSNSSSDVSISEVSVNDGNISDVSVNDGNISDGSISDNGSVSDGSISDNSSVSDGSISDNGSVSDGSISDNSSVSDGSVSDDGSVNDTDYTDKLDYDWLFNNNIDSFSSTLDINNNIVLVEVRSFMKLFIINYSNKLGNYTETQKPTIYFYKQFIEHYNNLQTPSVSGGKKLNKTRSKKQYKKTKQTKKYNEKRVKNKIKN